MDPSQDTHLARLLHQRGRLPLPHLLSLLEEARRSRGGRTLAQLLSERGLLTAEEARGLLAELALDAADPPRRLWSAGQEVAGLRIEAKLGEGGMGAVYRALDLASGATVAVKALAPAAEAEERVRFEREAQAQAAVDGHPNVIRIHRAGLAGDRAYLVMELAPGGDLGARIAEGALPPREAATLVRDLARGLSHVHAHGILHRDLKPGNVVFDEHGTPKLADFGLARAAGADTLTQTGTLLGTPSHMAPEQVESKPGAIGEAADVYGLGALLYHCLTQSPPFSGSLYEVLLAVLQTPPTAPSARRPEIPRALEAICLRALEKDPALRQESAAALAEELDSFLAGEAKSSSGGLGLALLVAGLGLVALVALVGLSSLLARGSLPDSPLPAATSTSPPDEMLRAQALHEEARGALAAHDAEGALAAIDSALALGDQTNLGQELAQLRSQTLLLLGRLTTLPGKLSPEDVPLIEIAKVRAEIEAAAATRVEVFSWDDLGRRASALALEVEAVRGATPWLHEALRRQVGETLFEVILQCPRGVGPRRAVEGWLGEQLPRLLGRDDPRIAIVRGLFRASRMEAFSGKLERPSSRLSSEGLEPRWQANLAALRLLTASEDEAEARYLELAKVGPPLLPGEDFARSPVEVAVQLDITRRVASRAQEAAFRRLADGGPIDPAAFRNALALRARVVSLTQGPLTDGVLALQARVQHEELLACLGDPGIATRPLPERTRTRILNRARLVRAESALDQRDAPGARVLLEMIRGEKSLDYETLFARLEALEGDPAAAEARLARAEGRREEPALATRSIKVTRELLAGRDPRVALREALAR